MRTAAILPVKRFDLAKSRLGAGVADRLRADLARAMVGDVLSTLAEAGAVERTIVVTGERAVARAAAYLGALVVADSAEAGQSAAVGLGVDAAMKDGFERVLCIPGDCPALDPAEIALLLTAGLPRAHTEQALVTIVPDRHGSGTNGLVLTPPNAIVPSFGPDSRARHERLAQEAGVAWRVERPASLLLDIDTGEDLAALRERLAGERERAPRTRAVLGLTAGHSPAEALPGRAGTGLSSVSPG